MDGYKDEKLDPDIYKCSMFPEMKAPPILKGVLLK